jgi:hypothetical protein
LAAAPRKSRSFPGFDVATKILDLDGMCIMINRRGRKKEDGDAFFD